MSCLKRGLELSNWVEQSYEDAKHVGEQAINLSGLLALRDKGELNSQLTSFIKHALETASLESIVRAQSVLQYCPRLIPQIYENELRWPEETKKEWIRIFGCKPLSPITWTS